MALRFDALFVHPDSRLPKELGQALWPEVHCALTDHAASIADAFQKQVEHPYNLCFISERLTEGLETFFKDMQTLGRDKSCFYFQISDQQPEDGSAPALVHSAFSGSISKTPTAAERAMLVELLQLEFHRQEVSRRVGDVKEAVALLIREIDEMARERQRGRTRSYDRAIKSFVEMHLSFDDDIYEEYITALADLASLAQSFEANSVDIPDGVLAKGLPNLTKSAYTGPSNRVWSKLLKRFGQRSEPNS